MQIFIADNSPVVCEQLITLLSGKKDIEIVGYTYDVPSAMLAIQEHHPDVVIMDIRMSGGNGFDLLDFIKRNHLSNKIIILSNYPYPQYRKRCLDLGANFFFDKATEINKITAVLN